MRIRILHHLITRSHFMTAIILQTQADVWNMFCLKESGCVFPVGEGSSDFFVEDFGGQKVRVDIPESSFDELTGAALDFEQVKQGMKTEVQQLEQLTVGRCLVERDALAKEKQVTVLTSRWVLTQKTSEIARCRIVVRDFATGGASALDLRANVVSGRTSVCARSFRGEGP